MSDGLGCAFVPVKTVAEHRKPFVFRRLASNGAVALHVLKWAAGGLRPRETAVFGWVECMRNLSEDTALPANGFRVHVCGSDPCTADYPVSKYGPSRPTCTPPLAHGRVLHLCSADVPLPDLQKFLLPPPRPPPASPPPLPPPASCCSPLPPVVCDASGEGPPSSRSSSSNVGASGEDQHPIVEHPFPAVAGEAGARGEGLSVVEDHDTPVIVGEAIVDPPPLASTAQIQSMLARAEAVGQPRRLIGSLELVASCVLRKRRLYVHLVEGWQDVMDVYAPGLVDATWHVNPFRAELFVCSREGAKRQWQLAGFKNASHYMVGVPLESEVPHVVGTSAVAEGLR